MPYYAQINSKENICHTISELSGVVENENLIEIDSYDLSLLGKKWNGSSWEEVLTT